MQKLLKPSQSSMRPGEPIYPLFPPQSHSFYSHNSNSNNHNNSATKLYDKNRPTHFESGDFSFSMINLSASTTFQHIVRDLIQPQTDHLTRRVTPHRNAVNDIRNLNRIAVMCDHNELRLFAQLL